MKTTTVSLCQAQGQSVFTKITTGPLVTDRNYSFVPSWGDYDNDGDLDVFVGTRFNANMGTGPNQFYRNNGDGRFAKLTADEAGDLAGDEARSNIGLWLDYDHDGDLDFAVGSFNPPQVNQYAFVCVYTNKKRRFSGVSSASTKRRLSWSRYSIPPWCQMPSMTCDSQEAAPKCRSISIAVPASSALGTAVPSLQP